LSGKSLTAFVQTISIPNACWSRYRWSNVVCS